LVIALGLYRLLPPSTAPYRPAGQGWGAVQADFDRATNELSLILAAQRGGLRPETVALVERNLAVMDAAIAESRAALAAGAPSAGPAACRRPATRMCGPLKPPDRQTSRCTSRERSPCG